MLAVAFSSCIEEDGTIGPSATVNLRFNAHYDGEPLVIGETYGYADGKSIKMDGLNFFVAGVTFLEVETEDELDMLDVGLVDFSGNTSPSAVAPVTFPVRSVPAVKYRGVRLSIGVPSNLNRPSILNYGAGHPVRQAYDTHFWEDAGSFFFMKLDGTFDNNGDGTFGTLPEDHPFELYPMGNANFTTLTLLKTVTVEDGATINLDFNLDIRQLLGNGTGALIDLSAPANLSTYNPENDDLSALLMGNFEAALTIE